MAKKRSATLDYGKLVSGLATKAAPTESQNKPFVPVSKKQDYEEFLKAVEEGTIPETGTVENPAYKPEGGWLPKNLRPVNKAFRAATLGSPLVGAAAMAALGYLGGYHLSPKIERILSPSFGADQYFETEEERKKRRKKWGIRLAALMGLGFLGTQFSPGRKNYGLLQYRPMGDDEPIQKEASGPYDHLTIGESAQLILNNPNLDDTMKANALTLLHSFDAPANTPINGGSLVGQAIGTGLSAMQGAAIGFLTANALGLPNPSSTAILGAVQSTLGTGAALSTSLIFGH